MTFRYNYLRLLGYRTIGGSNYRDPDTYEEWAELTMRKGKRLKHVRVANMTVSQVMEVESENRD